MPLGDRHFSIIMIDGIHQGDHLVLIALDIDYEGKKQVLGSGSVPVCAAAKHGIGGREQSSGDRNRRDFRWRPAALFRVG